MKFYVVMMGINSLIPYNFGPASYARLIPMIPFSVSIWRLGGKTRNKCPGPCLVMGTFGTWPPGKSDLIVVAPWCPLFEVKWKQFISIYKILQI